MSSTSASLLRNQRGAGGAGQVLAQAGGAGGLLARRAAKRQHQVDRARERNQLISETSLINSCRELYRWNDCIVTTSGLKFESFKNFLSIARLMK